MHNLKLDDITIVNKQEIPFNFNFPDYVFPEFERIELDNGINLVFFENKNSEISEMRIIKSEGAEKDKICGISNIASKMLLLGTKKHKSNAISEYFDGIGANISSNSGLGSYTMSYSSMNECFEQGIEKAFECYLNSVFLKSELSRLKKRQAAFIKQEMVTPQSYTSTALTKLLLGPSGYRVPISGTESSVKSIDTSNCNQWYDEFKKTKFTVLFGGNFNKLSLINKIINAFKVVNLNQNNSERISEHNINLNKIINCKKLFINKKDASQSFLRLGKVSIGRKNPDFHLYQLANTIFGGYFLSRLNSVIREQLGYTYGIYSSVKSVLDFSIFTISSNVGKNHTEDTLKRISDIMHDFSSKEVSEQEFTQAKNYFLGSFLKSLESLSQKMNYISAIYTNNLAKDYFTVFYNSIKNSDITQLFSIQKKYFKPNELNYVITGDRNSLKKFVSSQQYDLIRSGKEILK